MNWLDFLLGVTTGTIISTGLIGLGIWRMVRSQVQATLRENQRPRS